MAKKFSLETVIGLTDKFSAPMGKVEQKLSTFGKKMKTNFAGVGQDIKKMDKAINTAGLAIGAFAVAGIGATTALIQSTATLADEFSKTARTIGITSEELQMLSYAAGMQGVSSEALNSGLEKMMKNMGDLKNGTGTLYSSLSKMDTGLLSSLQSAGNTEEAFLLLMDAIDKAPDEFAKMTLAQSAFGKGGADLIRMANGGTDALKSLISESKSYGLITNEASLASEAFLDEQSRLKGMITGLKNQAFNAIIPKALELVETFRKNIEQSGGFSAIAEKLTGIINRIDTKQVIAGFFNFYNMVKNLTTSIINFIKFIEPLAPVVLTLVVAIKAITVAMTAYNAIMWLVSLNPITLTIMAIVAAVGILIAIVVLLVKNWDTVIQGFQVGIEIMKGIGNAIMSYLMTPINIVIDAIGGLLELIAKIPGVGSKLQPAIDKLNEFQAGMNKTMTGSENASYAGGFQDIVQNTKDNAKDKYIEYMPSKKEGYVSPETKAMQNNTTSTERNEVFLNAPSGYSFSQPGGAPKSSISFGTAQ